MKRRDLHLTIRQMIDHAREALLMAEGRTRADLDEDRQLSLSLVRLLEIIGEAANRIPLDLQARSEDIPWSDIIGLRNRLIHGYDAVDYEIVWRVVQEDLEPLIRKLEQMESPTA